MSLAFPFLMGASLLMTLANFLIRQTIEVSSTKKDTLLSLRLGSTAFFSLLVVFPHLLTCWNPFVVAVGVIAGISQGLMMRFSVRCMALGPSSLVLAIQNACCIIPAILMFSLFGENFGFTYTVLNAVGSILIAGGLFFAYLPKFSKTKKEFGYSLNLIYLTLCQVIFLTLFQWFALLQKNDLPPHVLLFNPVSPEEAYPFLPVCFATAFLINASLAKVNFKDSSLSFKNHIFLGCCGGAAGAFGGKLLELAANHAATPLENRLLFPLLAVSQVAFCSLWSTYLFSEKIVWPAFCVALVGLFVGLYG